MKKVDLIDVNANNVSDLGFFCCMSKRKSKGYQRKLKWLAQRFDEGMRIKMLGQGERGFIEYIPGEYAWRAVNAKGYMFIHCLWIVGKSKGKGFAGHLLETCVDDARKSKMKGVAILTSKTNWLVGNKLFSKHGFETVAQAPPSFELMVNSFTKGALPSFSNHWADCLKQYGKGLTVLRSDQCPYLDDATRIITQTADELGIQNKVVELGNCQEIQKNSPSPYGVFNVVYEGKLLSYHYLTQKELQKHLNELS